ncbi:MAG: hypothetical protein HQM16_14155, partial [Deltaproteobacteria bacterium]|nr:hypothetical protein [Deltaproteobacteria bacterium]
GQGKKSLKQYLKQAKAKLKELKTFTPAMASGRENVVDVIYAISKNLPPKSAVNFEVRKLNFKDDFISLDASTNDPLSVDKIVAALEDSERFSNVQRPDTKPMAGGIWYFTLKLDLEEKDKEEEAAP